MSFKNIIILSFLYAGSLLAQTDPVSLKLLDSKDQSPIAFAHFVHDEQKGSSDMNGVISFQLIEGVSLSLSHLHYGSWTIPADSLPSLIKQGSITRAPFKHDLYPVTIVGIKPTSLPTDDELVIQYTDRMEHDAVEILNQLPAFNSIRKGGNYGFDPVFRGFKYDQLNIVINGAQSATAACPNRMDPPTSQMSPNMMEKIEILKGPYALRYGTGFGATINFVPTPLKYADELTPYGNISTGFESNGSVTKAESQLGLSGRKYDVSLFGSWSQGRDYTTGDKVIVPANFFRASVGANVGVKVAENQELRILGMYNKAEDVDFPALAMDLRKDNTWLVNVRHDIDINKKALRNWNTNVYGSFVDHLMDNLLKDLDPRMVNAETAAKTYNYGGRTEGTWLFNKSKLYTGADARVEGAQGIRVREFLAGPNDGKIFNDNAWQEGQIIKSSLFSEYQYNHKLWNFVVSGRLEMNTASLDNPSTEFINVYADNNSMQWNPSISVGVQKSFKKHVKTGLWLGRAQRSGGLTERFINYFPVGQDPYEMLGNPDIKPEVNNQADLTFEWKPKKHMAISVDVFAAYMQDYISSSIDTNLSTRLPMSPGVRRFVNIDEAFKTGFEISWRQKLIAGLHHQFAMAYTYGQDLTIDEPLPEIAPLDLRYTLMGSYVKNKLKPEVMFRYVSQQSRTSTEFGESTTQWFFLLDLKLGYQLTENVAVNAGVNNLLDRNYYEHLNRSVASASSPLYAPGRNIFVNLNARF